MKNITVKILHTFPYLLHRFFHGSEQDFSIMDLTKTQVKTLIILEKEGQAYMSLICTHLNMEKGSFTPVVDQLLKKGLIYKEQDQNDRRKNFLKLTETGREIVKNVLESMEKRVLEKLSRLSKEDNMRFMDSIDTLLEITKKLEEAQ